MDILHYGINKAYLYNTQCTTLQCVQEIYTGYLHNTSHTEFEITLIHYLLIILLRYLQDVHTALEVPGIYCNKVFSQYCINIFQILCMKHFENTALKYLLTTTINDLINTV